MNRSTPKMRDIAECLIAYEAIGTKPSETNLPAAFRVCEKLRRLLARFAGVAGFRSLISRALILAKTEVAWLDALQLKADGSLECPEQTAELDKGEIARGEVILVAQLLELLVTFVGEALTLRLVQDVWPGAPIEEAPPEKKLAKRPVGSRRRSRPDAALNAAVASGVATLPSGGVRSEGVETAEFHQQLTAMNEALMLGSVRQHELTEALQATIQQLEFFSYGVTHDMRAPLRAMQGFGRILEQECHDSIGERGKDYLRRILNAAARMDQLITDILNFSHVAQRELPLRPVDVDRLVRGILESYPSFQPPNVDVQIEGKLPPVLGNEAALTQCIANLLGNAVKFVVPGMKPQVRIWAEQSDRSVRLFFRDNAIGIPPESHEKIFSIFQRLSSEYEGTGIGLAIVKKGMERMGGQVGVQSEVGKGSTFWLELRRADMPEG